MIVSLMAGFAFGYCVVDLISNAAYKRAQNRELLKTVENVCEKVIK